MITVGYVVQEVEWCCRIVVNRGSRLYGQARNVLLSPTGRIFFLSQLSLDFQSPLCKPRYPKWCSKYSAPDNPEGSKNQMSD